MAIAGFVFEVERGMEGEAQAGLSALPGITVHRREDVAGLVAVAERPSAELPGLERECKQVPGVLAMTTAYLNLEDELEAAEPAGA